jgi:hypothetical protein
LPTGVTCRHAGSLNSRIRFEGAPEVFRSAPGRPPPAKPLIAGHRLGCREGLAFDVPVLLPAEDVAALIVKVPPARSFTSFTGQARHAVRTMARGQRAASGVGESGSPLNSRLRSTDRAMSIRGRCGTSVA